MVLNFLKPTTNGTAVLVGCAGRTGVEVTLLTRGTLSGPDASNTAVSVEAPTQALKVVCFRKGSTVVRARCGTSQVRTDTVTTGSERVQSR